MKKYRTLSATIVFAMLVTIGSSFALATNNTVLRSSPTLAGYSAKLTAGSSSGAVKVSYDVMANTMAEEVGVASIKIYKANGNYVTTITGTENNGLIRTNTDSHRSFYTYKGTSGTSYYAVVTVTATIDGTTDTRDITTNTIKAP